MHVGLHSGRVWRNSIFSLFPSLVDIYAELLLSDGVINGIGRNGNVSDSSESDSVSSLQCMTLLTTPIFDFQ